MSELPPETASENQPGKFSNDTNAAEAFRQIFEEVSRGLRRFLASRLSQNCDVDDCLQAVYIAMIEHGADVSEAARRAWLFRVAANESARIWRNKSSTQKMLAANRTEDTFETDPADPIIRNENREIIRNAVDRLGADYRTVVQLRIHENLTFQQIADHLNIPLGTALTRMRRALDQLRRDLENNDS